MKTNVVSDRFVFLSNCRKKNYLPNMITGGMFYTIKVCHMLLSCWLLIHHGSGLRGGEVRSGWWENGAWVIYVEVVVSVSLIECFCSWETRS